MLDITNIKLPLWQLPVFVLIPLAVFALAVFFLKRFAYKRSIPTEERDWSVPPIADAIYDSVINRWDVRCKIVTILAFSFAIASLKHLTPALFAIGISSLVLLISRTSFTKALLRLLAIAGFISMFLIVMPFSVPVHSNDTVIIFGKMNWLVFNLRGLLLAATIAAKAVAITLLMEPLLSTAPLPVTLHGLSKLGVPEMAGQMVLLSYRYLHVFRHEARRMSSGMQVRGFRKHTNIQTLRAVANFLGMLLVRSFERTERVFDAMRARGYKGRFPEPAELHLKTSDLLITALWLAAGSALIIFDRIICQG
ncbi:MAG: cobalt ECF transporter T component CbiQ [Desulfobacterium sp.]|nr:cobalt ECF transporter T component CbiQ [Desulfobacterium sp.]MBU3949988.1 cobalt ECF transporter T component CbiQ [Pseudomonadota bacterium]MBU4010516.1 cobalt ECF transporter T component CbiQ [Pseudomonadota bacterium]MBU4036276.1 cobalt ECF transporter T component CbiQ [Pseudomonadota bacterium]